MELSTSVEDYVKAIWKMRSSGARVTTSSLAARRGVSGASASVMLRRLADAGLVSRSEHSEIVLTADGELAALRVVRRHRLLETFLVEICGLSWDEVDAEAEVLEHGLSARLEARIDEMLGHPTLDPHGDPIPSLTGPHADDWFESLAMAAAGEAFVVRRVSDQNSDALRMLDAAGVRPGVTLTVGALQPFGGGLPVTAADGSTALLAPGLIGLVHGQRRPA